MADNTSGNQGGQNKQSGLSWSQPSSAKAGNISSTTSVPKSSPLLKPAAPVRTTATNNSRKLALFFVGGVVVGGLLAWSWFSLTPATPVAENEEAPATGGAGGTNTATGNGGTPTLPGTVIGNEALVVPSPQDAGLSVMVSSATVNSPTWVVVYESTNGTRGNALGAALFFPQGGDKTINLLRGTVAGQTYLLGRHVDNGDKQFSLTNDSPVINAAGNPVYVEFRAR